MLFQSGKEQVRFNSTSKAKLQINPAGLQLGLKLATPKTPSATKSSPHGQTPNPKAPNPTHTSTALTAKHTDPFRLYNADVFKYLSESPVSLYEGWCWPGSSSWSDFFHPASWGF
ncbi:hypothetical protein EDB19DRAFT_1909337 [Suillus lakei]|nr:hypothetical protein EDB19DRAFT_1909337 [Suillus lakei]